MDNVSEKWIKFKEETVPGYFTKLLEPSRMAADPSSMTSAIPSPRREDLGKHDHRSSHGLCLCGSNRKKQGRNHSVRQVTWFGLASLQDRLFYTMHADP